MKLHLDKASGWLAVTAYGDNWVTIDGQRHERPSLLLLPDRLVTEWQVSGMEALTAEHMAAILAHRPELVLLGTGMRQRFPPPQLLRPLIEARVGVEVMDFPAACRTYNILAGEGRRVAAALILA